MTRRSLPLPRSGDRLRTGVHALIRGCTLAAVLLSLPGCASAVVGGAAATGVAAYQERGLEGVAKDFKIQAAIMDLWFKHDHTLVAKLGIEVYEGRVLLTGAIADEQIRADAVRLAWTAAGVNEVINEVQIAEAGGVANLARDSWITSQLKSKITFDKDVLAINYSIETVNGIVYLIGIAQHQAELNRVIAHTRTIEYVSKIVSHVRVKDVS